MAAELDSSKINDVAVVQDHLVQDHVRDLVPDPVVGRAPAQGVAAVLVAIAVVAAGPNLEHTLNPSPSLNPNPPSTVAHAQSPSPRLRGQSPGRSPNPKPSLPQRIDRAASVPEATDPDRDRAVNTARAVAVLARP